MDMQSMLSKYEDADESSMSSHSGFLVATSGATHSPSTCGGTWIVSEGLAEISRPGSRELDICFPSRYCNIVVSSIPG